MYSEGGHQLWEMKGSRRIIKKEACGMFNFIKLVFMSTQLPPPYCCFIYFFRLTIFGFRSSTDVGPHRIEPGSFR